MLLVAGFVDALVLLSQVKGPVFVEVTVADQGA